MIAQPLSMIFFCAGRRAIMTLAHIFASWRRDVRRESNSVRVNTARSTTNRMTMFSVKMSRVAREQRASAPR
jgi:hypothetical protein